MYTNSKVNWTIYELYRRLLKEDWTVHECWEWSNGTYTITLTKDSGWPYDLDSVYKEFDLHPVKRIIPAPER